ncbi:MAG: hypothetical protein HC831_04265 [Chloroflexia bacterium]|nr:hypothetical protein [Chloroflexia bacterium]
MLIQGNIHTDRRGRIQYFNEFDMSLIKRIYTIFPKIGFIRAWQGHKIESKWFYCIKGSVCINTIKIDDWDTPNKDLVIQSFKLTSEDSQILEIKGGYANGIKALEEGTILSIFSNFTLEESKNDDFRFDLNTWQFKENI